ncbi:CheR family methyltransferase [Pantanalinema rosaneae CENA516]|uniref:CheR family methyltransferase n=1 Tax=Pantanalinema rosaneae TaxID=1620701 RepID=UPI003D6FADE0
MPVEIIATLLGQRTGLDVSVIGDRKLARVVEDRCAACGLVDVQAYFQRLQASPIELTTLVEHLVVPETWFFRDRKPFDFLVSYVRSQWLYKSGTELLRVLSVPCSTGEEPYSIAIALLEAGIPAQRVRIDAIDISQVALSKAQQAMYGQHSFRGEDWVERERYFQSVDQQYRVCSLVQSLVRFQQGNVLELFSQISSPYDMIFCRNLLIYLDAAACRRTFKTLDRLLSPIGLLFVGAAETGKVPLDRFAFVRQPFTFAFRKLESTSPQLMPLTTSSLTELPQPKKISPQLLPQQPIPLDIVSATKYSSSQSTQAHSLSLIADQPSVSSSLSSDKELQSARELADAGYLTTAIVQCQAYLATHAIDADAHTLLGTLYQATAQYEQAERCFQKALYLQPHHAEALMQFALLKEFRGDAIGAQRLQQRLQKRQQLASASD